MRSLHPFYSESILAGRITGLISLIFLSKITHSSCSQTPAALDIRLACSTSGHSVQLPSRAARLVARRTMWVISSCAVAIAQRLRCTRATSSSTPDSSPGRQKPKTHLSLKCFVLFSREILHRLRRYCEKCEDISDSATLPQLSADCVAQSAWENDLLQNRPSCEFSQRHKKKKKPRRRFFSPPFMLKRSDRPFVKVMETQPKRCSRRGGYGKMSLTSPWNSVAESSLKVISPREGNLCRALCETDVE